MQHTRTRKQPRRRPRRRIPTTTRERMVRDVLRARGITLRQAAEEMAVSPSSLISVMSSPEPLDTTLERIRVWLVTYGGPAYRNVTNNTLAQ